MREHASRFVQENEKPLSLGAFDISKFNLIPKESTENQVVMGGSSVLLIGNKEFHVYIEDIQYNGKEQISTLEINITNSAGHEVLHVALSMDSVHTDMGHGVGISCSTAIWKDDLNNELPKGIGKELYKKVLDYIQSKVDQKEVPIEHVIVRTDDMAEEKWHEVFNSIIAYGYENFEDEDGLSYRKVYYPEKHD